MSRNATISVAIFAVLLVITLATHEDQVRVGMRTLALPTLSADTLSGIEIRGKYKATLKKEGEKWTVADPDHPEKTFPVEESAIKRVLDELGNFKAGRFVTGRATKHADLQVDDKEGTQVVFQSGSSRLAVVFGRYAKGGGNYMRKQGSDEVFIAKGALASALRKNADQWRQRAVFGTLKPEALKSVTIQASGEPPYTLRYTPGTEDKAKGTWTLADKSALPPGFRVDKAALGRVARAFASLRAYEFADDVKASDAGLNPQTQASAQTQDGRTLKVTFGKQNDKKLTYFQVQGDPQIYLAQQYVVDGLLKPLKKMRDLTLMDAKAEDIVEMTFTAGGSHLTLSKKDGSWSVTDPTTLPPGVEFDPSVVPGKLSALLRTRALRVVEGVHASDLGPGDPRVELKDKDGKSYALRFGGKAPKEEGKPGEQLLVTGSADTLVYAIGTYQRDRYKKPFELFKPPPPPPQGMGGGMGGMPGLDSLPPDIRKKIEEQMRNGQFPPQ